MPFSRGIKKDFPGNLVPNEACPPTSQFSEEVEEEEEEVEEEVEEYAKPTFPRRWRERDEKD